MNIVDPLHEHARRTPSRAAVVHPGGTLTWAQLDRALCSGADFLHARGIRPGARVGLTIRAPIAHLVASLALAIASERAACCEGARGASWRHAASESAKSRALIDDFNTERGGGCISIGLAR